MSTRELILLSPYRLPTHSTLYLGDDEVAAFLNAYAALWHPAALATASGPPRLGSPYDYEEPSPNHLYAVPETPPLMLPDDWDERVRNAGALVFRAGADRAATLANLREALRGQPGTEPDALLDLDAKQAAPFLGIGFGYVQLEALCEAMSHENLLATPELWQDVAAAVAALRGTDPDAVRVHLQAAADRLLSAREVLYPVTLHLLDLYVPDPEQPADTWWTQGPGAPERAQPLNLVACAALLERLARQQPERLPLLRERCQNDLVEICGGDYLERADALLPLESQLWNLVKGQAVYQELLGQPVRVFARRRFGFHPQLPALLQSVGMGRAVLVAFDESVVPAHRATVVSWSSADGKTVEAFTRTPHPGDSVQTYFHLAHYLHQAIMQDQAATLALVHRDKPVGPWYDDFLALSQFAPVLGRWTTLSGYLNEVMPGDYPEPASADDFHGDYLVERTPLEAESYGYSGMEGSPTETEAAPPLVRPGVPHPVSGFAQHLRARRRLDTAWGLAALYRGLGGQITAADGTPLDAQLSRLEERLEREEPIPAEELTAVQDRAAAVLAGRLVARGPKQPGFLVLNPCSFKRRVVLELPGISTPPATTGAVKACQVDGDLARLVVEVPALGFAWLPRSGGPGGSSARRMRLADERSVRNEFFEAEIDPHTGGLKAIRDQRLRISRLGQQLVFNPGSSMKLQKVQTTSTGPALGEIVTEGVLLDTDDTVLATFRQRFRAWLGRPVLDLRIEIIPGHPPRGYPWHSYYGARFAWRDERATLLRGVNGTAHITGHTRPETIDFLEVRLGRQNAVVFPGGLPFHQRHGGRMLDVILIPPGETEQAFDLAIGLDRDYPMQTALGLVSPVAVVPTEQGPPHVGAEGWLFHLDAPNLLLTSMRPAPDGADAVVARLLECSGHDGPAELRCARNPVRAVLLDSLGTAQLDAVTQGDAVALEVARNDLLQLRIDFS